jgi:hypothetical protein
MSNNKKAKAGALKYYFCFWGGVDHRATFVGMNDFVIQNFIS